MAERPNPFEYIRQHYRVPAKRLGRIRFRGTQVGTIVGADGAYLKVRIDGERLIGRYHPTWCIEYLGAAEGVTP